MNNKKKIKKILIILILILVILFIVMKLQQNKKRTESFNKDKLILTDPVYVSEDKGKIYPENSFQLIYTYSGQQKLKDEFYEKIYIFENYLHYLYKASYNLNNDELLVYYDKNKDQINENMGTENSEQFLKIVDLLKTNFNDNAKLKKSTFKINEKGQTYEYTSCPIEFEYDDGTIIQFILNISNFDNDEPLIQFLAN